MCNSYLADNFVVSFVGSNNGMQHLIGIGGRDPSLDTQNMVQQYNQGAYQFRVKRQKRDDILFDAGKLIIPSTMGAPQSHICSNEVFTPIVEGANGKHRIYGRYNINIGHRKLQVFHKVSNRWEFESVVMFYNENLECIQKYSVYAANVVYVYGVYIATVRFNQEENPCHYGFKCDPTLAPTWHIRLGWSSDGTHFILQNEPLSTDSFLFPVYGCYSIGLWQLCFLFNKYGTKKIIRRTIEIIPDY